MYCRLGRHNDTTFVAYVEDVLKEQLGLSELLTINTKFEMRPGQTRSHRTKSAFNEEFDACCLNLVDIEVKAGLETTS